jgi:hypothetical protein
MRQTCGFSHRAVSRSKFADSGCSFLSKKPDKYPVNAFVRAHPAAGEGNIFVLKCLFQAPHIERTNYHKRNVSSGSCQAQPVFKKLPYHRLASNKKRRNMRIKKPLLIAGTAATIGLTSVAGIGVASAASSSNGSSGNGLVDKIAGTFNLDKTKVQAVFDADRKEHQAERQAKIEKALTQAVKDGKLTETQKSAILAKIKEAKAGTESNHDAMKGKTPAERKSTMKEKRIELEAWAKKNNIPTSYLYYIVGGHGHHGPGGPMNRPDDSSNPQ